MRRPVSVPILILGIDLLDATNLVIGTVQRKGVTKIIEDITRWTSRRVNAAK